LLDGIAALGLVTAAPRMALCASDPATVQALRALCAESTVAVVATPAVYPSCPEADVPAAGGHAYTVAAGELANIGALVRGVAAPHLCTVAGAVASPQVVSTGESGDASPAALVRRCGGARVAAWVAIAGGALGGVLWPADAPLPPGTSLCLIVPVTHPLVARLRRGAQWLGRARNACLSCQACTDFCPVAQSGVPLFPHRLMRGLARGQLGGVAEPADELLGAAHAAAACTGCGACSVMCPADLLPGAAVRALAATLTELGAGARPGPGAPPPVPVADRRVPLPLLLARLGLDAYVQAT
jgi:ferredoxin